MTCERIKNQFDDYIDEALEQADMDVLRQHVESCDACGQLVDRELKLRRMLREYGDSSMPTPDATHFDRTLIAAAREGRRQHQRHSWMTGFSSAIAAGLAVWIVSSFWFSGPSTSIVEPALPTVTMAMEEPRTVNLVFTSARALQDATLTVLLPEGVQIAGFEGQREITWMTDLAAGKNVLPLRLIATMPTNGVLLATLRHGGDDRTFRLRVDAS